MSAYKLKTYHNIRLKCFFITKLPLLSLCLVLCFLLSQLCSFCLHTIFFACILAHTFSSQHIKNRPANELPVFPCQFQDYLSCHPISERQDPQGKRLDFEMKPWKRSQKFIRNNLNQNPNPPQLLRKRKYLMLKLGQTLQTSYFAF